MMVVLVNSVEMKKKTEKEGDQCDLAVLGNPSARWPSAARGRNGYAATRAGGPGKKGPPQWLSPISQRKI
jgi:hypothetical protein